MQYFIEVGDRPIILVFPQRNNGTISVGFDQGRIKLNTLFEILQRLTSITGFIPSHAALHDRSGVVWIECAVNKLSVYP